MIFTRKGVDINRFPAIHTYLTAFRAQLEPKPDGWIPTHSEKDWSGRKAGSYEWYELQDPVEYWAKFLEPKLLIRRIEFYPEIALDVSDLFVNDSAVIIPKADPILLAILNAPLLWYYRYRTFPHKKDEALAMDIPFISALPLPSFPMSFAEKIEAAVGQVIPEAVKVRSFVTAILDWLKLEFGVDRPGRTLETPERLDADGFAAAVRAALPRRRQISAAEIARLKREHAETIQPAREAAAGVLRLERRISDLVNAAYGLTPRDVALMWSTAPPRTPLAVAHSAATDLPP